MNVKSLYRTMIFICFAVLLGFLNAWEGTNFAEWKWYSSWIGGVVVVALYLLGEYLGEKHHKWMEKKFSLDDLKTINKLLLLFILLIVLSIPILLLIHSK